MASRAERRRPGVVPNDLRRRIDDVCNDFSERMTARFIASSLGGLHPSLLDEAERAELTSIWGEAAGRALEVLAAVGYGESPARRGRAGRAHGVRRKERLRGVIGKLPRALALRLPTTADTHRTGRNDGRDRWGRVRCSLTLRSAHLGVLAAAGGLWAARARDEEVHVDVTAGELVELLTGRQRIGGKDVAWVHGLLADLQALDLRADVEERTNRSSRDGSMSPSAAHRIPAPPVDCVERRVGDRWVAASDYADAVRRAAEAGGDELAEVHAAERVGGGGSATIRIHLADWFRAELGDRARRPVFINFAVWAHLRPQSQRTYAFLQAHGRDDYDGRIYFYRGDRRSTRWACEPRAATAPRPSSGTTWRPYGTPTIATATAPAFAGTRTPTHACRRSRAMRRGHPRGQPPKRSGPRRPPSAPASSAAHAGDCAGSPS